MRGNRIHSRASKRIRNDHRTTATDEFEHRILRDGVHDDIVEDGQLAQLEDAIATLEDVRDERRRELGGDDEYDASQGAEVASSVVTLHDIVSHRVQEICAERCRIVLLDGDEWVEEGYEEADAVAEAKREASNWLLEHPDVCERLWGDSTPDIDALEADS
ncbi:hypothetical protein ACFQJC_04885 [Haloferax namakaokahaiae]|uniref:Uncharacterized protein n=1 Tax=Haloferax namakaokahaiae TaxID=1748331 RepID=A0ABD5ZCN8_9EURY